MTVEPFSKARCILQPDAAAAEKPRILVEKFLVGRVVEIDALVVREPEFHSSHRVAGTGILAQSNLHPAARYGVPVDRRRIDGRRILSPVGKNDIARRLEVAEAL